MKNFSIVFDDGPRQPLCKMVDKIREYGWSAGFAVVGKKISDETEHMLKYAIDNGFQLVSHGQNHVHMDNLNSEEKIKNELLMPIEEIERRIGYRITMARLPFLSHNEKVLKVSKELNLPLLGQGIGFVSDWDPDTAPETISEIVVNSVSSGAIGCLHVSKNTCIALDYILPVLKEMGYSLLTPEELFFKSGVSAPLGVQIANIKDLV